MEPTTLAVDIVDTARAAGCFKTLCSACEAANLVDTLRGAGPITVFAPDDDAFADLPSEAIEDLLKPANRERLTGILTYHVVPGRIMAADLAGKGSLRTVAGPELTIHRSEDAVMVDNATITKADIECSNGVIHIIDAVLMTPAA